MPIPLSLLFHETAISPSIYAKPPWDIELAQCGGHLDLHAQKHQIHQDQQHDASEKRRSQVRRAERTGPGECRHWSCGECLENKTRRGLCF